MKRRCTLIAVLGLAFGPIASFACEVCKKQQPKVLRGITHGAVPQSDWDYIIVVFTVIIVALSLFYCIKWIIYPGEKQETHIKRSIFNL